MIYKYCVSSTVSIALEIPEWGYGIHGHDVDVEVCYVSKGRVNIEYLKEVLDIVVRRYDHKPLRDSLGTSGYPLIEDMLEDLCKRLKLETWKQGLKLASVAAHLKERSITLQCG